MNGVFSKRHALIVLALSFAMVIGLRGMDPRGGEGEAPAAEGQEVAQLALPINLGEMGPRISALVERLRASGADVSTLQEACRPILKEIAPVIAYIDAHGGELSDQATLVEELSAAYRTLGKNVTPGESRAAIDPQVIGDGLVTLLRILMQINGVLTTVQQDEVAHPLAPDLVAKRRITPCKVLTITLSLTVAALAIVTAGTRVGWWHINADMGWIDLVKFIPGLFHP